MQQTEQKPILHSETRETLQTLQRQVARLDAEVQHLQRAVNALMLRSSPAPTPAPHSTDAAAAAARAMPDSPLPGAANDPA